MSDLDKLMKKLKDDKETPQETEGLKEKPVVVPVVAPVEESEEAIEDELDEDLVEDEVEEKPAQKPVETPKEDDLPVNAPAQDGNAVEHEVAILQNNGVFRRELLMALKELVDVQKVNAQVMIDIKNAVTGDKDAK